MAMRTAMILAMVAKSFIITYSFDLVGTLPQYFTWWLWPLCTWDFPATFDLWLPESINGKRKTLSLISECHSYSRMVISDFISECHSHSSWPSTQPQSHWQHHHDLTTLKPKPENNIQWLIGTSPKVYNHLFVGKVGKRSVNCQLVDALSFLVQKMHLFQNGATTDRNSSTMCRKPSGLKSRRSAWEGLHQK